MFWSCGLWTLDQSKILGTYPPKTHSPRPNSGEARASPETWIDREIDWRHKRVDYKLQQRRGTGATCPFSSHPFIFQPLPPFFYNLSSPSSAEQNILSLARTNTPAMKTNVKFRNICIACNISLNNIRPQDSAFLHRKTVNVHIEAFSLIRLSKPKMTMIFRTTLIYLNQD